MARNSWGIDFEKVVPENLWLEIEVLSIWAYLELEISVFDDRFGVVELKVVVFQRRGSRPRFRSICMVGGWAKMSGSEIEVLSIWAYLELEIPVFDDLFDVVELRVVAFQRRGSQPRFRSICMAGGRKSLAPKSSVIS